MREPLQISAYVPSPLAGFGFGIEIAPTAARSTSYGSKPLNGPDCLCLAVIGTGSTNKRERRDTIRNFLIGISMRGSVTEHYRAKPPLAGPLFGLLLCIIRTIFI